MTRRMRLGQLNLRDGFWLSKTGHDVFDDADPDNFLLHPDKSLLFAIMKAEVAVAANSSTVLDLPTGAGKPVVFAKAIRDDLAYSPVYRPGVSSRPYYFNHPAPDQIEFFNASDDAITYFALVLNLDFSGEGGGPVEEGTFGPTMNMVTHYEDSNSTSVTTILLEDVDLGWEHADRIVFVFASAVRVSNAIPAPTISVGGASATILASRADDDNNVHGYTAIAAVAVPTGSQADVSVAFVSGCYGIHVGVLAVGKATLTGAGTSGYNAEAASQTRTLDPSLAEGDMALISAVNLDNVGGGSLSILPTDISFVSYAAVPSNNFQIGVAYRKNAEASQTIDVSHVSDGSDSCQLGVAVGVKEAGA